jgi:hypothetical protein
MTKQRFLSMAALILLTGAFGIQRGVAYIDATIAPYQHAAPCGRLPGVAGLLQAAHFIPQGNCTVTSGGECANSSACTIAHPVSGGPTTGKCTTTGTKNKSCSCQ